MGKKVISVKQEGSTVTFEMEGQGSRTINVEALTHEVQQHLITYGLIAKVTRSYAGSADDAATSWAKACRVMDALEAGTIAPPRSSAPKNVEALAIIKALKRVPPQYRRTVAEQLIADGAPVTMEKLQQEGII